MSWENRVRFLLVYAVGMSTLSMAGVLALMIERSPEPILPLQEEAPGAPLVLKLKEEPYVH